MFNSMTLQHNGYETLLCLHLLLIIIMTCKITYYFLMPLLSLHFSFYFMLFSLCHLMFSYCLIFSVISYFTFTLYIKLYTSKIVYIEPVILVSKIILAINGLVSDTSMNIEKHTQQSNC